MPSLAKITSLTALCSLAALAPARAAQPAALPQLDEVTSSQSVFIDDPKFGKDPFFPKSSRRVIHVVAQVGVTPDTGLFTPILNSLVLKGISGLPGKRLALINNRTVEAGETFEFRHNNQLFKLRCVEVREKSVVIGIDGITETREIHLRQGL